MTAKTDMRILFLDLDGTVRFAQPPAKFINKPDDLRVYYNAHTQVQRFLKSGWDICFISNQGGIGEGFTTDRDFRLGVDKTLYLLGLPHTTPVGYCPHKVHAGCACRKPNAGLVDEYLAYQGGIGNLCSWSRDRHLFVGDRPEDKLCAVCAGVPFMDAKVWRAGIYTIQAA